MFQTKVVWKMKTQFHVHIFPENRVVYKLMFKNMVEPDRWQHNTAHVHCMLDT